MDIMTINGEEWVLKSEAELSNVDNIINNACVGKKVIVRSRNEGINAGTVVAADETGIVLSNCRRLWYHKPADKKLSWYEGVAMSGISDDTKVSCTVRFKAIVENYSITFCENDSFESIMSAVPNAQN